MKSKNLLLVIFLGFYLLTNTVLGLPSISSVSPESGDTRVSSDVILAGYIEDTANLTIHVYFLNSSKDMLCSNESSPVNTTVGCKNFSDLPFNTEFCWYMNITNGSTEISSYQCFTTRKMGLHIDFDEQSTTIAGLGGIIIGLVDVGIDVIIFVLGRMPEIAVLILVVVVIITLSAMVKGMFGSIGGFLKILSGKKSSRK